MPETTHRVREDIRSRPLAAHAGRVAQLARRHERVVLAGLVLSLAYYYVIPSPLLALPGLLVFLALTWLRLDFTLCILPLTFPFWYVPKRVIGHEVFPLSEVALAICVAMAVARELWRLRSGVRHLRLVPRGRALLALAGPWITLGAALCVLGTTAGVLVARHPHEALRAYRWEVIEPLLYITLVVLYARHRTAARIPLWAFLGSGVIVAALAIIQVLWLHVTFTPLAEGNRLVPYVIDGNAPRATAFIYGSGNSVGAWLERALPLALALALTQRAVGRRERALAALCVLLYLPALVWSASRGAWVGAAVACLLVACLALRWLWLAGVALAGALVLALIKRDTIGHLLLFGHGGSGEVRLLVWLASLHMIRDHPLFGIGPDQFLYYYSNRYTNHPYWISHLNGHTTLAVREPDLAQPHNLLLDLWLSGGILALVGFLAALVDFWRRCLRLWLGERGVGWRAAAALGVGALMVASVVHGMVDNAYFAPDLALAFWWTIALLITLERRRA